MKHDGKVIEVDVRAVDVGYFNTKYTLGRDARTDRIKPAMFPSIAPRRLSTQQIPMSPNSKAWLIGVGGVDYLVGPGAPSQASGSEPRPVHEGYALSDKYHAYMLGALNHMAEEASAGREFVIDTLVVGLPLTTFSAHFEDVKVKLVGEHLIGRSGGPVERRVTVREVRVMVQPHGALVHFGADDEKALAGINVVVDPGGGTLDWFLAKDEEPNWARSGAYPKAMLHCALAVADCIDKGWRNQYDIMEAIDTALRTGAATFMVGPKEYRMAQYRPAVDAVLEEAVKTMLEKTGSLENARRILFVGGGGAVFYEYMARQFPSLKAAMALPDQPVFANLYGFHLAGELARGVPA